MRYEVRYVALLDIIGFSNWILSDEDGACVAKLSAIYSEIRSSLRPYTEDVSPGWISLTLFSDMIVLSTRSEPDGTRSDQDIISEFLWCVRRICLILLKHGFLARGCVLQDR